MKPFKFLSCLLLPIFLSGCFSLLPKPADPPRLYTLTPKSEFSKDLPQHSGLLIIEQPHAGADIDTDKIATHLSAHKVDYYNQAKWTDRSHKMMQNLMVESFENSRKITAIASDAGKLRADYILMSELKEFQTESYHGKDELHVHVGMNVKLIKMPERKLVTSQRFDRILMSPSFKMDDIVATFDEATGKILKKIVVWTVRSIHTEKAQAHKSE